MTIRLNGSDLTVTQVMAVARHGEAVALAPEAVAAMRGSRAVVEDVLAAGEPVYGLTTGVGERKSFLLDPAERQRFNLRLVLNHRIAQGDAAPADVVRGAMLCLANSYAKGVTGVRPELAQMIVTLLNEGFAPPVRRLGSIGQGDLGPMADLAHGMITRSGFEVAENEGLALVSSNAFTTAWACIATADADALLSVFDVAGRARPGGVRRQPELPAPGHRADQALPRPGQHAAPAPAAAGGQLPVAARRGPVPAGSADLPLHPAHPRRGPGRAGLHPDHPGARAQLLAVQPGRGGARRSMSRAVSSRSATSTSARSRPPSTSSGSRSPRW